MAAVKASRKQQESEVHLGWMMSITWTTAPPIQERSSALLESRDWSKLPALVRIGKAVVKASYLMASEGHGVGLYSIRPILKVYETCIGRVETL